MSNDFLKVDNLSVNYFGGYVGISNVSFSLKKAEILPFFGNNYSGKSSLLRGIANLEQHVSGNVIFNEDISRDMVYSFSYKTLKNNSSVYDQLAYPLRLRNIEDKKVIENKANYYKIGDLLNKKINQLTKDQKILVALCRALIRDAKLYLLDNPLNELSTREEVFDLLRADLKDKTVIYATNNIEEAFKLNSKVGIISYGQLCQIGEREELINRPNSINVLSALGINSFLKAIIFKENNECKFIVNDSTYVTNMPINDIYLNKEVKIPIINGQISNTIYFDEDSEYIVSKRS